VAGTENILAVNPGSTSTKIALFAGDHQTCAETVRHPAVLLQRFAHVWEQYELRLNAVRSWASTNALSLSAVVGMGGLFRPVRGGTYLVNERMLADARANLQGEHPSNLGCAIAHALAQEYHCRAFVIDPVSVDELEPLARYSGHPAIQRSSLAHALNLHAAADRAAAELGIPLATSRFVIAHLGGGISVAPVCGGSIMDVNDASSDGPFSPEGTGGLPLQQFITLCCSGKYSEREMRSLVRGTGGLVAYLGTNSALEVEKRIAGGDTLARETYEAMAYQISKEIGAMATVLAGNVNAVVLTGGLASSSMLVEWIIERVKFIAPVLIFPGEDEMRSLALGALQALRGQITVLEY
jgi:butyrate kinase